MNNAVLSTDKIYVAGHQGMVGSSIMRRLQTKGYRNIVTRTRAELDLTEQSSVRSFFNTERPRHVFMAAARVGGIHANNTYRAEFIYQNLMIEANIIHAAYLNDVDRLLLLGSSCIYPKHASQPMSEECLLSGPLELTNKPYAIAKIAGLELCAAYRAQYGSNFFGVMPTNLYGPGDSYDLENSHVIPALIRKMHEAKTRGDRAVTVWGTGTPRREFLYCEDLADACMFLMERATIEEVAPFVNVGVGVDVTIRAAAEQIAETIGFGGELVFDSSKPDGAPRKLLDVTRLQQLGWTATTSFAEGLRAAYADFQARYASASAVGVRHLGHQSIDM